MQEVLGGVARKDRGKIDLRETFGDAVRTLAHGGVLTVNEARAVYEAAETYPWFMTVRLMRARVTGMEDAVVELHYSAYPRALYGTEEIALAAAHTAANSPSQGATDSSSQYIDTDEDAIERFLKRGDYRITPDGTFTDDDAAAASGNFDPADAPVSEKLAEIYLAQGLVEQAKEIYSRLSLLNPEKSVYFAEIIAKIERKL